MTPVDLIGRIRSRWRLRVIVRGMAVAVLGAIVVALLLMAVDVLFAPSATLRRSLRWLPLAAPSIAVLVALRRAFPGPLEARFALLVDERFGIGNVFSTLFAFQAAGPVGEAFRARAHAQLGRVSPARIVPLEVTRVWSGAMVAAVVATVVLGAMGGRDYLDDRWLRPAETVIESAPSPDGGLSVTADAPPTLGSVTYTVRPPAYAAIPTTEGGDGAALSALPGSVVEVRGAGSARPPLVTAEVVGGSTLTPLAGEDGWTVRWTVGPDDRGLALGVDVDGETVDRRVLPLHLLRDRPPTVELVTPPRDVAMATATGVIPLRAVAEDDYGVAELSLRWVRSRGSGESFDFEEGVWDWDTTTTSDRGIEGRRALDLEQLDLGPGDVLHVRATAADRNDVTGPGLGASATRQIRIVRGDQLVEVTTLVGFPIEREREPILSQRMVILLTEELLERATGLAPESLAVAASEIADEQARLRGRMGEQIFSRATDASGDPEAHLEFEEGEAEPFLDELEGLAEQGPLIDPETGIATISNVEIPAHEHDSDPIIALNRSLLQVYNLMWDAERLLRLAALEASLVPQHAALDELQRIRESERVFARGRVSVSPIDVAATRGTGELDDADPGPRLAPAQSRTTARELVGTVDELLTRTPAPTGRNASVVMSELALELLRSGGDVSASESLTRAAASADDRDAEGVGAHLRAARRTLLAVASRSGEPDRGAPTTWAAARYLSSGTDVPTASPSPEGPTDGSGEPGGGRRGSAFTFATARYESGDWDSAPLVPNNLIHSLAQYTDLDVASEGVVVELGSREALEYPFLYLTGHLPVFFNPAESRNLVEFVDRGGLFFIDDHNHDIDGAFHSSVTAELRRLFGADALQPLPTGHELYRSFFVFDDGPPITGHELSGWGDGLIHRELLHIEATGRIGVLYSNKD